MMYCPKCGAQNPDGSRFCGSCGTTFEPASGGFGGNNVAGGTTFVGNNAGGGTTFGGNNVAGGTTFVGNNVSGGFGGNNAGGGFGSTPVPGGFGLFTIISVVAVLIAAVLLIMPSLAGKDYDDYFEDNSGGACITSFTSDLGHSASVQNDNLADQDDLSKKQESAMAKMGTAALANSPVYVLWIVAMGSIAIAVFDAIKSKTKGSIPMIVAGFACFLVALLWIIAVGNYFGALDDLHNEIEIGVSWTVWVALFAGLAAGVVALLEKLGILRD